MKLKKQKARVKREGAAVVEFAVCLPLVILIVLGTIEAGSLLFLKQTLVQAAYEGAKVAIATGDTDQVEAVVDAVLVVIAYGVETIGAALGAWPFAARRRSISSC